MIPTQSHAAALREGFNTVTLISAAFNEPPRSLVYSHMPLPCNPMAHGDFFAQFEAPLFPAMASSSITFRLRPWRPVQMAGWAEDGTVEVGPTAW